MSILESLVAHAKQPEYIHVLLNPLPVYGLAMGAMALVLGMLLRSRQAQLVALVIIFVCAASAWPVIHYGHKAYDVIEPKSQKAGYEWLSAHGERALRAQIVYYILAGVALVAMLAPWKFPKTTIYLSGATLIITVVALGFGGWIAYAGGPVRHPEFRYGSPPERPGGYEELRDK